MYKKMSTIMKGTIQAMLDSIERNNVAYFVGVNVENHPEQGYKMATEPMDDTSLYIHRVNLGLIGWITHVCFTTTVSDEHLVKNSYWFDGTDDEWLTDRMVQMNERAHITPLPVMDG